MHSWATQQAQSVSFWLASGCTNLISRWRPCFSRYANALVDIGGTLDKDTACYISRLSYKHVLSYSHYHVFFLLYCHRLVKLPNFVLFIYLLLLWCQIELIHMCSEWKYLILHSRVVVILVKVAPPTSTFFSSCCDWQWNFKFVLITFAIQIPETILHWLGSDCKKTTRSGKYAFRRRKKIDFVSLIAVARPIGQMRWFCQCLHKLSCIIMCRLVCLISRAD